MTRQRYSSKESVNRILRSLFGGNITSDAPETLSGEVLSFDEALSDLAELLYDSLPNQTLTLPESVRNAMGNAGFYRGWGGGNNFFVDPNSAAASDANSGKSADKPLATIQQAITNAEDMNGDNIWVIQNDGWQYARQTGNSIIEAVTVPSDKSGLHIMGAGYGSMGVNWTTGVTGTFCLTINAVDTVVDGFNFWGDPVDCHGIFCDWEAPTEYGENEVIRNCTFVDTINIAIQMEYSWYNRVYNCHFQECGAYGIFVDPAGSGISYVQIHDNYFDNCAFAMALDDADNCSIYNNRIYNAEAQVTGSATNMGLNTAAGSSNIVSNNWFSCILPAGVGGDWDDFNSASATDAWIGNHCMNGLATSNPT